MSEAIKRFNGLSGTVDKKEVKKILVLAGAEGQQALASRLATALKEAEKYEIVVFNPGPLALEEIPACDLPGIDHVPHYITPEEFTGLNKAVSPDDIYQFITDLMINTIKNVGSLPWEMTWEKTAFSEGKQAINYESKKGYRGVNFFLLNFKVEYDKNGEPYLVSRISENPYFLTFKQIEKFGGKLKAGAKGSRVVYFTRLYSHSETLPSGSKLEFSTYDQKKFIAWINKNKSQLQILKRGGWTVERLANSYIPILKYYNVFNGEDVTGIEWGKLPKNENASKTTKEKIEIAEAILASIPNPPAIKFGGNQPAYYPQTDSILIPPIEKFRSEQEYYSTFFHELVHSTGHKKRLSRPGITLGNIKSKLDYAKEELVAEMGAVFLCAESGILFHIIDNSAAYLKGWNSKLIDSMTEDNRFYFRAASASQAAADYILNRDKKGVPAYQKQVAALAAPWHEGLAKQALNNCSRLNPGYKYGKDGKLQRSKVTLKTLREICKKAKDFDAAYKAVLLLDVPATVVKVLREKYNKDLKLNPKQVFELFYSDVTGNKKTSTGGTAEKKDSGSERLKDFQKKDDLARSKITPEARKELRIKWNTDNEGLTWEEYLDWYSKTPSTSKKIDARATEKKVVLAKEEKKGLHKFDKGQTVQVSKRWGKTQPGTEGIVKELRKSAHGDPMYAVTIGKDLLFFPEIVLQLPKKKLSKEELEKANPEPKSNKPKSISVQTAVADVLRLDKFNFKEVSPMKATVLFNLFKNVDLSEGETAVESESDYVIGVLKNDGPFHVYFDSSQEIDLTSLGVEFINAVKNRLESLRNQKHNYALFDGLNGAKSKKNAPRKRKTVTKKPKSGLKSPIDGIIEPKTTAGENSIGGNCRPLLSGKHPKVLSIKHQAQKNPMFAINGETARFLQAVEKKPVGSVVVTLDGEQGAGKTTALYKYLNDFATAGNRCLFASLEEHPSSNLATEKRDKYLTAMAQENIDTLGHFDGYAEFAEIVQNYDAIFADSWQKLIAMIGTIRLDEDVRKKFNGKVFFIVFQQTTEGRTKGGASIVFDGDIVIKMVKTGSFNDNYAYFDKNRYTTIPIEKLKYFIDEGRTVIEGENTSAVPQQNEVLSSTAENEATYNFKVY
ncbi:MAG: zincin-like metallopeptidase domain-containing protein [Aequorivita sp.]|nr:zincin-like metallopeptidase domain-containing protein [Aequorivita sp.]